MIAELLPKGKRNAIATADLMAAIGCTNIRKLREIVAKERKAGAVILSTKDGKGGYYIPDTRQEVEEFVQTLDKESKSIMQVLKSAKRYLNQNENQIQLEL